MGGTGSFSDKDNCPLSAVIGKGMNWDRALNNLFYYHVKVNYCAL